MTLVEMAAEYRCNCALLRARIDQLKAMLRCEADPLAAQSLRQRLADLTALYREGREVALHMERYYDRRYYKDGKFTF